MGLAGEVQAQVLIMPTGPLCLKARVVRRLQELSVTDSDSNKFYPGRTMGGGTRFHRIIPPPSSLRRWKE
jgi:hypothetical protein